MRVSDYLTTTPRAAGLAGKESMKTDKVMYGVCNKRGTRYWRRGSTWVESLVSAQLWHYPKAAKKACGKGDEVVRVRVQRTLLTDD